MSYWNEYDTERVYFFEQQYDEDGNIISTTETMLPNTHGVKLLKKQFATQEEFITYLIVDKEKHWDQKASYNAIHKQIKRINNFVHVLNSVGIYKESLYRSINNGNNYFYIHFYGYDRRGAYKNIVRYCHIQGDKNLLHDIMTTSDPFLKKK